MFSYLKLSIKAIAIFIFLVIISTNLVSAKDDYENEFYYGKVTKVVETKEESFEDTKEVKQSVKVFLQKTGKEITAEYNFNSNSPKYLEPGNLVIINKTDITGESKYYVYEVYRLFSLLFIFALFLGLVILFAGKKGFFAFLGLLLSILIIYQFIVPSIFAGKNPFIIGLVGSFLISILSIYTSHGINKRTSVALASTLMTLSLSVILSTFFVSITNLFGLGSEEAFFLQGSSASGIDLKGLLLCGIIIGTLGVLDDVTTAQVAAVDEIRKANLKLKMKELYSRGLSVGREHILSMVNTLVLAYAGTALPLFMLFLVYQDRPFWVILNSEFIAEEIVRTLSGSIALVLAVPISTFLAAYILPKTKIDKTENHGHSHFHG